MSHIVTIAVEVRDLDAIRFPECRAAGLSAYALAGLVSSRGGADSQSL